MNYSFNRQVLKILPTAHQMWFFLVLTNKWEPWGQMHWTLYSNPLLGGSVRKRQDWGGPGGRYVLLSVRRWAGRSSELSLLSPVSLRHWLVSFDIQFYSYITLAIVSFTVLLIWASQLAEISCKGAGQDCTLGKHVVRHDLLIYSFAGVPHWWSGLTERE